MFYLISFLKKSNIFILALIFFVVFFSSLYPAYAKTSKKSKLPYLNIEVVAKDGFFLKANYYPPKIPKNLKAPLIVLVHSLGYDNRCWQLLPQQLQNLGFAVLNVDLRGHGKSNISANLKKVNWSCLSKSGFEKYPFDLLTIIYSIQKKYPQQINSNKIILIGSDIGANTCILAAEKMIPKPVTMVLICPSLNIKGLYIPISLANCGYIPILAFAAKNDRHSISGIKEVSKFTQGAFQAKIFPLGAGISILNANPKAKNVLIDWCCSYK